MGPPNDGIGPNVHDRLYEIFHNHYKHAKSSIQDLESKSKRHILSQIVLLEEAFDHIANAVTAYPEEKEKQLQELDSAEDCLKRISIESKENLADELYSSILKVLKKPRIYYKLVFLSLPDKVTIEMHLERFEYHFDIGRSLKSKRNSRRLCLKEFEKAYHEAKILEDLLPSNDEAKYRFVVLLFSIIAVMVSVTMAITSYLM
jgi:hypothetical protein